MVSLQIATPAATALLIGTVATLGRAVAPVASGFVSVGTNIAQLGVYPSDYPARPATRWVVEPNPNFPTQPNSYRIRDMQSAGFISTYTIGGPLDSAALADAVRRSWLSGNPVPQTIECAPGCDFQDIFVGDAGSSTSSKANCYWGPQAGPFQPIHDIYIVSQDPAQPVRVNQMHVARRVKNNASAIFDPGPIDELNFFSIEFFNDGTSNYCWDTSLGEENLFGKFGFYDCHFKGANNYGGTFDTKTCVRAAYAEWEFIDCTFGECVEHCVYTDAVQGYALMRRCYNTSNSGNSARCGRTFCQFEQRSSTGLNNQGFPVHGGPAGFGTITIEECIATRTGDSNAAGAFTFGGFLGTVTIRNCQVVDCEGGIVTVWSDTIGSLHGLHTNLGDFVGDLVAEPFPYPGSAYTTTQVVIENLSGNVAANWPNPPTAAVAISGAALVQIGPFDIQIPGGQRPTFSFWPIQGSTCFGGPLDNLRVEFDLPTSVSSYPGFNGNAQHIKYATTVLNATQQNALTPGNDAYPPFAFNFTGATYQLFQRTGPTVVLDADAVVTSTTGALSAFPNASIITLGAGAVVAIGNQSASPLASAITLGAGAVTASIAPAQVATPTVSAITLANPTPTLGFEFLIDRQAITLDERPVQAMLADSQFAVVNSSAITLGASAPTLEIAVPAAASPLRVGFDDISTGGGVIPGFIAQPNASAIAIGMGTDQAAYGFDFPEPGIGTSRIWKLPVYTQAGKRRALLGPNTRMRVRTQDGVYHEVPSSPDEVPPTGMAVVHASVHLIPFEEDQWSMELTTLARVKALHGSFSSVSQHDAILSTIIQTVSARAERYMRRTVLKSLKTERYPVPRFDTVLFLTATPVTSITEVKYSWNTNQLASATALSADVYVLESGRSGTVRFQLETTYVDPRRPGYAEVTYLGGMAEDTADFVMSFPDIAAAVDQQALYEFQRKTSPGGNVSTNSGGTGFSADLDWLPSVRGVLDSYRKHVI